VNKIYQSLLEIKKVIQPLKIKNNVSKNSSFFLTAKNKMNKKEYLRVHQPFYKMKKQERITKQYHSAEINKDKKR